jgi:hypothetical protein
MCHAVVTKRPTYQLYNITDIICNKKRQLIDYMKMWQISNI